VSKAKGRIFFSPEGYINDSLLIKFGSELKKEGGVIGMAWMRKKQIYSGERKQGDHPRQRALLTT
jgi:hypothetical protein